MKRASTQDLLGNKMNLQTRIININQTKSRFNASAIRISILYISSNLHFFVCQIGWPYYKDALDSLAHTQLLLQVQCLCLFYGKCKCQPIFALYNFVALICNIFRMNINLQKWLMKYRTKIYEMQEQNQKQTNYIIRSGDDFACVRA